MIFDGRCPSLTSYALSGLGTSIIKRLLNGIEKITLKVKIYVYNAAEI